MKTNFYIEHNGKKIDYKFLSDRSKDIWKSSGNRVKDLESQELYYKPDEQRCYYVFNGDIKGSFEV